MSPAVEPASSERNEGRKVKRERESERDGGGAKQQRRRHDHKELRKSNQMILTYIYNQKYMYVNV